MTGNAETSRGAWLPGTTGMPDMSEEMTSSMERKVDLSSTAAGLESCTEGRAYLLPTTPGFLTLVAELEGSSCWLVVGSRSICNELGIQIPGLLEPVEALARLEECWRSSTIRVGIFTDQLVGAEHACLLMEDDQETFFSTLEVVLALKYGLIPCFWNGVEFESVPETVDVRASVMDVLKGYYRTCESMEDWLPRSFQIRRGVTFRCAQSKRLARLYQSTLLLSMINHGVEESLFPLLSELASQRRRWS